MVQTFCIHGPDFILCRKPPIIVSHCDSFLALHSKRDSPSSACTWWKVAVCFVSGISRWKGKETLLGSWRASLLLSSLSAAAWLPARGLWWFDQTIGNFQGSWSRCEEGCRHSVGWDRARDGMYVAVPAVLQEVNRRPRAWLEGATAATFP